MKIYSLALVCVIFSCLVLSTLGSWEIQRGRSGEREDSLSLRRPEISVSRRTGGRYAIGGRTGGRYAIGGRAGGFERNLSR